ncbi:MAG: transcriptional regulator [Cyanobacteria bacterium PR.023]|jgi:DNA-binding FrmR family transcriptional regulator|nr:transcriptional regulator [Cyanobacteria bacterium PR.023]
MHTKNDKKKLLNRVSRIRGQLDAIERGLEKDDDCSKVLQTIAACRGAMNGLMSEVLEGHILSHLVDVDDPSQPERVEAAYDLVDIVRSYLK